MRVFMIGFVCLLVGAGMAIAVTRAEFSETRMRFRGVVAEPAVQNKETFNPVEHRSVAVVEGGNTHNFGTLARNESRDIVFRIRNDGKQPLKVDYHGLSCGQCVSTDFKGSGAESGDYVEIPIRFSTRKPGLNFHEYAEVRTNDPDMPVIRLNIEGKVTDRIQLSATELDFENISANQITVGSFDVFSFQSENLEILSHEFTFSDTADKFRAEYLPKDLSTLKLDPLPKAARTVKITIEKGLPVGPLTQAIRLNVKTDETGSIEMPIAARVLSDVSIVGGRRFRPKNNVLSIGKVRRDEGATAILKVMVKGPERDSVDVTVQSVTPDNILDVSIGEPREISNGTVKSFPVNVTVPKGLGYVNFLGSDQGKPIKIVLQTTHRDAKQLLVYVRFATE